jgi:NAD(P)-dependent dehydrogenase (short-subunit alcohol dehydrogenase family)
VADRLAGKVAMVTGAGSIGPGWGNGKAAAVLFAREGARVYAVDVSAPAVHETKAIIEDAGGQCETFVGDISSPSDVAAMVADCQRIFGGIDVLHNNVGIGLLGGLTDTSEADWDRVMAVNMKGMFLMCKQVVPVLADAYREDGRVRAIVNIGAVAGMRWTGIPMIAYSVSKGAIEPLTRSIALEYARRGVRCNSVLPGLMNTPFIVEPMTEAYGHGDMDRMIEVRNEQVPMGRMGTAWDVAHAALFLASDEAAYITGQALVVDGGQAAQTWSPSPTD